MLLSYDSRDAEATKRICDPDIAVVPRPTICKRKPRPMHSAGASSGTGELFANRAAALDLPRTSRPGALSAVAGPC